MFAKFHITFIIALAHGVLALSMGYPLCTADPALTLEAGKSFLSAIVQPPMGRRCEATLHFSDPSFLPLRYSFDELECDGSQVLGLTIPKGAPNGDVDIIWQCTGIAPTCNHGTIVGGNADVSIASESTGNVGCLVEVIETRTAPVTVTRSSSTFVNMEPTIVLTTTTSFSRRSDNRTTLKTSHIRDSTVREPEPTSSISNKSNGLYSTDTTFLSEEIPNSTTSGHTVDDTSTMTAAPDSSVTSDTETRQQASYTESGTADDTVFLSDASKMRLSILPAVTASLVSTVFRTVTAKCTP